MLKVAVLLAAVSVPAAPVLAQSNPGWFVPPASGGAGGAPRPAAPPPPRPQVRAPVPTAPVGAVPPLPQPPAQEAELPPPAPVSLPPMPDLPQLPRGATPPASVIGVLSVPDIMRVSQAAQQIEKTITERREKLNQDAQAEQAAWREPQQQLANSRTGGANADQIRAKERELQDRITNAQKQFRDRNRIIQETLQFGLGQIEQVLSAVVRQVSESRGMNLVLHRAQVVLNVAEFDMTDQVADQLNKALPQVVLPPDGVSPSTFSPARPVANAPAAPGGAVPVAPASATAAPGAPPATPRR